MFLDKILDNIKNHMNNNSIEIENVSISINIPGRPQRRLIDLSRNDIIQYLLNGREGKIKYKYFEPIIEKHNGEKICTYIIYV